MLAGGVLCALLAAAIWLLLRRRHDARSVRLWSCGSLALAAGLTLIGQRSALPLAASATAGGLERDLAEVNRDAAEQDAEQRLVVRAPQSGTVSTVLAETGQSVSPASALATLVPEGAVLQAQLYAPGRMRAKELPCLSA